MNQLFLPSNIWHNTQGIRIMPELKIAFQKQVNKKYFIICLLGILSLFAQKAVAQCGGKGTNPGSITVSPTTGKTPLSITISSTSSPTGDCSSCGWEYMFLLKQGGSVIWQSGVVPYDGWTFTYSSVGTYDVVRCARYEGGCDWTSAMEAHSSVTIQDNPCEISLSAGSISANESVCGTSMDPANITGTAASGSGVAANATFEYAWESSTNGSFYSTISGATGTSYDPPSITQTTWYNRKVRVVGCTTYYGTVSPVKKTLNPALSTPVVSVTQPTCTSSTGTITVSSPTGAGITYTLNGSAASSPFTGLSPGTYTIQAIGTGGCNSGTTSATVNAQPTPASPPSLSISQPYCGSSLGSITVTSPTGSGFTYNINGGAYQSSTTFNNLSAGSYAVLAKSSAGCISTTSFGTITAIPTTPIAPTVTLIQPSCAIPTGTITVSSPVGSGYTYSKNNGAYQSSPVFSGLAVGSYTITVKNGLSCGSNPTTAVIDPVPSPPTAPTLNITQPTCNVFTGTITVTAPTGANITYSKNGVTYQTSPIFSGLAVGTYSITAKSGTSCATAISTAILTQDPSTPNTPTVIATDPTCTVATGTITITAPTASGMTYSIDDIDYSNTTGIFTGVAVGIYNVRAKSSAGCKSLPKSIQINTQPPTPIVPTATIVQPTCVAPNTGKITITAPLTSGTALSTKYTYSIDGINYQTGTAFSTLVAGTYTVTVKNGLGCVSNGLTATLNVPVGQPSVPTATLTQPTCAAQTSGKIVVTSPLTVTGSTYTYSKDGITYQTSTTFSGLSAGTYTIYVKKTQNGCVSSSKFTLALDFIFSYTVNYPSCTNPNTIITITNPLPGTGVTYKLYNDFDQSYTPYGNVAILPYDNSGNDYNYWALIAYKSGCGAGTPVIFLNPPPEVPMQPTATVIQPTCNTATGTITVALNPLETIYIGGILYSIDNVNYQTSNVFSDLAPGTYQVWLKSVSLTPCTSTPITVLIDPVPSIPITPAITITQPTCSITTGTITITAPIGAGITYSIDGIDYTNTTGIFSGLLPGTYNNITAKNTSGCVSSVPMIAVIDAVPSPPATPLLVITQPNCMVATGTIIVAEPVGTGLTYSINGSAYTNTTGVFTGLTPNMYTILVKDVGGCISTSTDGLINLQPPTPPAPSVTATQPTCATATGTITVTAPIGLTYSIDDFTYQGSTTFANVPPGTYNVTAQTNVGCISSPTNITINAAPIIPVSPTAMVINPTCAVATGTIIVTAPTGADITYSIDNITYQASTIFSGQAPGTYSIIAKNTTSGCVSYPVTQVVDYQPVTPETPILSITPPSCTVATGTITVTSPVGITYSIDGSNYSNTSGTFTGLTQGTYSVTAKGTSGCVSTPTSGIIIAQPITPPIPTVSITQPTCAVPTGTITVTAPTGGPMYNLIGVIVGNTTGIFSVLDPGTYSINAVDGSNYCASNNLSVTINAVPNCGCTALSALVASATPSSMVAGNASALNVTGTGITAGTTTFSWTGTGGFSSAIQAPSTGVLATVGGYSYTVTATNANGTGVCTATATTSVNVTAAPVACTPLSALVASATPTSINTGSASALNVTGTGITAGTTTFSWTGTGGFSSAIQAPSTGTIATAGGYSYTVTATNANGTGVCTATATTSVNVTAAPVACTALSNVIASATPSSMTTGNASALTVTGTGIVAGTTTFSWTGTGGFSSAIQAPSTGVLAAAGGYSYTVTATNANGTGVCTATATTSVNVTAAPVACTALSNVIASATPSSMTTGNASALTVTGTGIVAGTTTFSWTGTGGFSSAIQAPSTGVLASAGGYSYTVTATNANGTGVCTATATTSVNVTAAPVACTALSNVIASATPSSMTTGNASALTVTGTGIVAGTTTFSWTGTGGFSSAIQAPSTGVLAAAGGYSYTVTATNANGTGVCTATATTSVNVTAAPVACTALSNVIASATPSSMTTGNASALTVTGTGIVAGTTTFSWTGTGGFSSAIQAPSTGVLASAGGYSYTVTATNADGTGVCTATATTSVNVTAAPVACTALSNVIASATPSSMTTGNASALTVTGTGIVAGTTTFSWTGTGGFSAAIQAPSTGVLAAAGGYSYTVTATNANGTGVCTATATTSVNVTAAPVACTALSNVIASATPSSMTTGNASALTVTGTGIVAGTTTFSWTGTGGFSSAIQAPSTGVLAAAGGYSYTVTATNANGTGVCTATATTSVNVTAAPVACTALSNVIASATPSSMTTGNASALTVTGTGIVAGTTTFSWTGTGGFSSAIQAPSTGVLASAGGYSYTVTATNANGTGVCTATATTSFTVTPACTPPTGISAGISQVTCTAGLANADGKITLSGFTTEKYDLFAGDPYAGTATFATATTIPAGGVIVSNLANPAVSQVYTIRVFNGNNCYTDLKVTLNNKNCSCPVMCQPVITRKTKG